MSSSPEAEDLEVASFEPEIPTVMPTSAREVKIRREGMQAGAILALRAVLREVRPFHMNMQNWAETMRIHTRSKLILLMIGNITRRTNHFSLLIESYLRNAKSKRMSFPSSPPIEGDPHPPPISNS